MKKLALVVFVLLALASVGIAAVDIQGYEQKGDLVYIYVHAGSGNWSDEPINVKCVFTFFPNSGAITYDNQVIEDSSGVTLSPDEADTICIRIPTPEAEGSLYRKNNCKVEIWYSGWQNIYWKVGSISLD